MNKKIKVTVINPTGSESYPVGIPAVWKVERFINELRDKLKLPATDDRQNLISYDAILKRTNSRLDPQNTIEQSGIMDDDVIRLRTTQEGGNDTTSNSDKK